MNYYDNKSLMMGNLFLKSECDAKQKKNSLRDILKTDNVTNWLITNINGLIFMWPEYWLYASLIFRILFVKIFFFPSPLTSHTIFDQNFFGVTMSQKLLQTPPWVTFFETLRNSVKKELDPVFLTAEIYLSLVTNKFN